MTARVTRLPQGGALLDRAPEAPPRRVFSILLVGSTDGARLQLEPPQCAGLSALEATAVLARVSAAGLFPIDPVPPGTVGPPKPAPAT